MDSDAWNTLWMCFVPPTYDGADKLTNAFLHTKINGNDVFNGVLKTGTRSARRTSNQDPERDLYVNGNNDKKLRILGHWGSKVQFKNIVIRSVRSE